jgi:subfamily B ATP-binding cassette protein MsbA
MRPHAAALGLVLALVAVAAGATGLYPVLIARAYDAFAARDAGALVYAPALVVAVTAVKGFALYAQIVLTNRVVTRIEANLQAALYGHLIEADLAQIGRESPAALTQRFTTDFAFIKEALTRLSTVRCGHRHPRRPRRGDALDRPRTHPRRGRRRPRHRPAHRPDRPQAAPGLGLDAGGIGAMAALVSESLGSARIARRTGWRDYLKGRAERAFDEVRASR